MSAPLQLEAALRRSLKGVETFQGERVGSAITLAGEVTVRGKAYQVQVRLTNMADEILDPKFAGPECGF